MLADDPDARLLAGGASLVAMMNAGLVTPSAIVSLRDIPELQGIREADEGWLRIGAMVRHRDTAQETRLSGTLACVRGAAASIANPPVRNMGTIGGSISLSDPGADYPASLVAAGAVVEIAGPSGTRRVPAAGFFIDWYTTALEPGELVTAVLIPPRKPGFGSYAKLARVSGDFAIASVALCAATDGSVSVAVGGCGPRPVFSSEANELLAGHLEDAAAVRRAGEILAGCASPVDDVRASARYRRLVIPRLLARAATEAGLDLRNAA